MSSSPIASRLVTLEASRSSAVSLCFEPVPTALQVQGLDPTGFQETVKVYLRIFPGSDNVNTHLYYCIDKGLQPLLALTVGNRMQSSLINDLRSKGGFR